MTRLIDTNIIIRLLTKDDPSLFLRAKKIFETGEVGKARIYLDEIVLAETIWVLLSHYRYLKEEVCPRLTKMLSNDWVINPRKTILLEALDLYSKQNFGFVDCWLRCLSKNQRIDLETFDEKLKKLKQ